MRVTQVAASPLRASRSHRVASGETMRSHADDQANVGLPMVPPDPAMDPDPGDVHSGGGGVTYDDWKTTPPQCDGPEPETETDDEPEDPDNVDTSPMCPCGTCPDGGPFPCVRRD